MNSKNNKIALLVPRQVLAALKGQVDDFYLAGGTALSLVYFQHRESYDLDFFTKDYSAKRILEVMAGLKIALNVKADLIGEQNTKRFARMAAYRLTFANDQFIKVDFVEDFFNQIEPLNNFNGIPVLSLADIYLRKVMTVAGHIQAQDETGKGVRQGGRQEPKDFYDLYYLSTIRIPLSEFVDRYADQFFPGSEKSSIIEGLNFWYRSYDRMAIKTGLLDLMTDKPLDFRQMDEHFKKEIDTLMKGEIGAEE